MLCSNSKHRCQNSCPSAHVMNTIIRLASRNTRLCCEAASIGNTEGAQAERQCQKYRHITAHLVIWWLWARRRFALHLRTLCPLRTHLIIGVNEHATTCHETAVHRSTHFHHAVDVSNAWMRNGPLPMASWQRT